MAEKNMTYMKIPAVNLEGDLSNRADMPDNLNVNIRIKAQKLLCGMALIGSIAISTVGSAYGGMLSDREYVPDNAGGAPGYDRNYIVEPLLTNAVYFDHLQYEQLAQTAESMDDVNDPLEGFNRSMFAFNQGFYDVILDPLASAYNVLPPEARTMIGGVLSNLSSPVVFINDILQFEPERAFTTARRFVINTIFGFGGIADVASSFGLEEHDEDFGQTLAVWGVGEGFYLVLPVLGPGNPRDSIGRFLIDPWIDPVGTYLDDHGYDDWIWVRYGVNAVHEFSIIKDDLRQLESTSVDYYAAVRSLYRQRRDVAISNGDEMELPAIPDFEFGHHSIEPLDAPALGGIGEKEGDDDQISYLNAPQLGQGDLTINDPFAVRFDPVEGVDSDDPAVDNLQGMLLAPRKPGFPGTLIGEEVAEAVVSPVIPVVYTAMAYGAK